MGAAFLAVELHSDVNCSQPQPGTLGRAVALKPGWSKAHQRMGAAFLALELYSEAKESYETAAKMEPDNQVCGRVSRWPAQALELSLKALALHVLQNQLVLR